jgi:hypothetical protein
LTGLTWPDSSLSIRNGFDVTRVAFQFTVKRHPGISVFFIPAASVTQLPTEPIDEDITGMVFPVYYGELPVIIKRVANNSKFNIEISWI